MQHNLHQWDRNCNYLRGLFNNEELKHIMKVILDLENLHGPRFMRVKLEFNIKDATLFRHQEHLKYFRVIGSKSWAEDKF